MFEKYEHEGKPFTKQIAMELIFKTYEGKPPIDEHTIIEEVYQIHESCGGLPPKVENLSLTRYSISDVISFRVRSLVRSALSELERNGGATRENDFGESTIWTSRTFLRTSVLMSKPIQNFSEKESRKSISIIIRLIERTQN